MLIEDVFCIVLGFGFVVLGLAMAKVRPRWGAGKSRAPRAFGLGFAAFAAILLIVFVCYFLSRGIHLQRMKRLTPAQVSAICFGKYRITNASDVRAIVQSLNAARVYSPDHGNFADDVILEVIGQNGVLARITVGWSFERPGAVLWFFSGDPDRSHLSHGYAFSESLPEAIEKAGFKLPRFRGHRIMRTLTAEGVRAVRIDGRRVDQTELTEGLLDGFKRARLGYSRTQVDPIGCMDIFLETADQGDIHLQAIPEANGNGVIFWYCTGDSPKAIIRHGCARGGNELRTALEKARAGT